MYTEQLIIKIEEEAEDLLEKIKRLSIFLDSAQYESIDIVHQRLLHTQYRDMRNYYSVLKHRIELLKKDI